MKRITILIMASLILLLAVSCGSSESGPNELVHDPGELITDWNAALLLLEEGNRRYVTDSGMERDTNAEDRDVLSSGQQPFAVIVTCSDSRVPPEIYFDQKLGDIFVIRNAGNIADRTALGSIEYAAEHLHAPLVVVVGHSQCGAVGGALSGGEFSENLQTIIDEISPNIAPGSNLQDAIRANIESMSERIKQNEIIKKMGTTVIGAHYNITTGQVEFIRP